MYGLINSALQSMIREKFGDETWERVLKASGVPKDSFLSMRSYDDTITFALANAASDTLGAPLATCLEMFGEYWILETAQKSYGALLSSAGSNMVTFLENINALHDRITTTFINYIPPEFRIEYLADGHYHVHYISTRKGLSPFVVGLLRGLAIRFGTDLTIHSQQSMPATSGEHTVFEVTVK